TQSYNNSHVLGANGSTLLVNSSGVGLNSGNGDTLNDYAISYVNNTGTITPASVTVTANSDTKVFDGTTTSNVAVTNVTGLVGSDSLTGLTQSYNNSHVLGANGSTLLVNSSGVGLNSGNGDTLNDYAITYVNNTGTITPASVTVTASSQNKVYDGTTASNVAVTNVTGLVGGDSLTGLTQSYNNSHVLGANGSTLLVNSSGVGLNSGNGDTLNDYAISYVNNTGTITPASVTVTASSGTKVFDGTTASNVAVTNVTGLVSGDSLTGLTQSYNNSHVLGTNGSTLLVNNSNVGVTGSAGSVLGDYAISYVNNTGTITPASVTVTASSGTKVYDGTTASNVAVTNITGLVGGDSLTGLTQSYNNSNVLGTNGSTLLVNSSGVGLSSGNGDTLGDYVITYVNNTGTITPRPEPALITALTFNVDEWRGARWANYYVDRTYPAERLTVTQTPESFQMLEVAMTGELPTEGPVEIPVAGPSSRLNCKSGSIRTPDGVDSLPVNECTRRTNSDRGY
ncbi:hypothetical protein CFB82_40870, partial [Burkholderia sp. HI2714]|uniref:beta strand repeat-containing protein n=1 Tax=Burkholderia sp. HI2714 TaxID=2015359 RepID=UPI000B921720